MKGFYKFVVIMIAGLSLSEIGLAAAGNLISNGSFEAVTPALSSDGICGIPFYGLCIAPGWNGDYQIGNRGTVGRGGISFNIPQPYPDGVQALILQGTSSAEQFFTTPVTATYSLTFSIANRSTSGINGPQTVAVLIDGIALNNGNFANLPIVWTAINLSLNLSAGPHLLTFRTVNDQDVSAFIDNVSLAAAASQVTGSPAALPPGFRNGSFESVAPSLGANQICGIPFYGLCFADGWTGRYQIGDRSSAYGIPQPDPDGVHALILQDRSIASQFFTIPLAAAYKLSFSLANRNAGGALGLAQTVFVLIDGSPLPGGTYMSLSTSWTAYSISLSLTAGVHVLSFQTLAVQDVTAYVDNVSLSFVAGPPSVQSGGVVSAAAFGGSPAIAPGSWIEIYGSGFASISRSWTGADFSGFNAPNSLDGVSVTIDGQKAFVDYISPGQVNALVPSTVGSGQKPLVVTTTAGNSAAYTIAVNSSEPGLLSPSSFSIGGKQYVTALFSDGVTYALLPGAIPGINSRRAKPGDTVTLYGIGFGPVTPNIPAGQIVQQSNSLVTPPLFTIGGVAATSSYSGLAPGLIGLYQFNVVIPNIPPNDAVAVAFTIGGVTGKQTLVLPVQNQ